MFWQQGKQLANKYIFSPWLGTTENATNITSMIILHLFFHILLYILYLPPNFPSFSPALAFCIYCSTEGIESREHKEILWNLFSKSFSEGGFKTTT